MTRLMDIAAVAAALALSPRTIETMLARGDLPRPIRFGRVRRWHPDDIERYLLERAEAAQQLQDRPGRGRPRNKL
jgi:predicted DNA-binding transcriptional regulator AlpA